MDQEIIDMVAEYSAIIVPLVTYIVTGIVAVMKIVDVSKQFFDKVKDSVESSKEKVNDAKSETMELRYQVGIMAKENQELREEVRGLCRTLNKVGTYDEKKE